MDLCTLQLVKDWLKVPTDVDDALLALLITASSTFIESVISRSLSSQTYTETKNGTGGASILFKNYPVTAVQVVIIDNVYLQPAADYTQPGFMFDSLSCTVNPPYRFTKGWMNVTLRYTAGYAAIPMDIQQVCMELVGKKYRERDRIGQTSKTLAGEIVSFVPTDLTPEIKSRLRQYQSVVPQ